MHGFAFADPAVWLVSLAIPVVGIGLLVYSDAGRPEDRGGWAGNAAAVYITLVLCVLAVRGSIRLDRASDVSHVLQGDALTVDMAADGRDWEVTLGARPRPPVESLFGRHTAVSDSLAPLRKSLGQRDALQLQAVLAGSSDARNRRLASVLRARLVISIGGA